MVIKDGQVAAKQDGFRPEIQALRALAVALVVAFHLFPAKLTGGFIGVDVFFVISGFLITSHLTSEVRRTGTVQVTRFWARRIRRLLPAAFTVLAACTVAMFLWLPELTWMQTIKEIAASALYVQNWSLASDAVDYLAADNTPTLVQHYWSLSVEEQFYFVWPLLIVAAAALTRNRRAIIAVLATVFALSLAFSVFETMRSQPSAYFITPTRAWEFAAGGLLAFLPQRPTWQRTRVAASWAGLALIVASAATLTGATPFPGWIAALPVAGTAAIIWAGHPDSRWSPTAISTWGPIQAAGDLSYSIYLWHWPLIVLYPHIRGNAPEMRGALLIVAVTVILALLTKRFIEDPVRRGVRWRARRVTFGFAAAGATALLAVSLVTTTGVRSAVAARAEETLESVVSGQPCYGAAATTDDACRDPFSIPSDYDPSLAAADRTQLWCISSFTGSDVQSCDYGAQDGTRKIALLGDSHANVMADALDIVGKSHGWTVSTYVKTGCPGVSSKPLPEYDSAKSEACAEWSTKAVDAILASDANEVIFTAAVNSRGYYRSLTADDYSALVDRLRNGGLDVRVILDTPATTGTASPECLASDPNSCEVAEAKATAGNTPLLQAAKKVGVPTFDPSRFLCQDGTCYPIVGGVGVYFDKDHITRTFNLTLAPYLEEWMLDR